MKVWTIVILLLSLVVLMDWFNDKSFQVSAAWNSGSKVQLVINQWVLTCTWWNGILNMGSVTAAFWWQSVSWTYAANSWKCMDTMWWAARAFTIRITWDLYDAAAHTISSWNASICIIAAPSKLQWWAVAFVPASTIPVCNSTWWLVTTQDLLRRTNTNGEIYEYWITPKIQVAINAAQQPGTYTWVLEVSIP